MSLCFSLHIFEAFFCLIQNQEIAKFSRMDEAVDKTLMLVVSTPRQEGESADITTRRGSGLFISGKAFGDASGVIN